MTKVKDYIHSTLITDGYSISYVELEEHHLKELISRCEQDLEALSNNCHADTLEGLLRELTHIKNSSVLGWDDKYDICWKIKDKMFEVCSFEWYDPDTSYEEDFMAFYLAAKEYIGEL